MFLDNLPTVDVATDACPISAGGYFRGDWFYHNFSLDSPEWDTLHVNHKETLAIVLAATRWGRLWSNQRVVIHVHSDNQAAVHIINKGTTGNPLVMQALRALLWLSAVNNFHITTVYLEGANNTLADSISRIHEPKALFSFYSFLCAKFSAAFADSVPLTAHMSIHGLHFISCRSSGSYSGCSTQSRNPRISLPALR